MKKIFAYIAIAFGLTSFVFCQAQNDFDFPKDSFQLNDYNTQSRNSHFELYSLDSKFHTSIFPARFVSGKDSLTSVKNKFAKSTWLGRKLFNENFIDIRHEDYNIVINPLLQLNIGSDDALDKSTYRNSRGVQAKGSIIKKVFFYTEFLETQERLPLYVDEFAEKYAVIPGEGKFKDFKNGDAKDFGVAAAHITYQPNKYFNFQFGTGKHFIGDGYRSLLLSDNSFNYPYFRITTEFWNIKYWVLYTKMLDINEKYPDGTFLHKYVTSHYLSWNINKRLNIGLFESVIYADFDRTRGYDLNYLNPIIFYRPIEFSVGSTGGNVILGLNAKVKLTNKQYVYGQFVLDEFNASKLSEGDGWWANKFGWQIGLRSFDSFTKNLTLQTELNFVRPYTFSHKFPEQNYGHYNQSLSHPLNANFIESVSLVSYNYQRWFIEAELMIAKKGLDPNGENWGSELYESYDTREQDFGNVILQGIKTDISYYNLEIGYTINPNYNLRIEAGFTKRDFQPSTDNFLPNQSSNYFYFGLNTKINNSYRDF